MKDKIKFKANKLNKHFREKENYYWNPIIKY